MKKIKAFFSKLKKKINKIPRKLIFWSIGIILVLGLLYRFKNQFVVAIVNGRPISRLTLVKELERQGKKQVLENIILKTLILQEAKKQKIIISDEEITTEISKIEESIKSSGQDLNQVLQLQGISQSELRLQIKIQKMVEKLAGKDISVSEEEIKDYQEKNKDTLPKDKTAEEIKQQVSEQLMSGKLNQKIEELINNLRQNAKVSYF